MALSKLKEKINWNVEISISHELQKRGINVDDLSFSLPFLESEKTRFF